LRREVGWREKRRGFVEGMRAYRKAYEAAGKLGDPGVERIRGFVGMAGEGEGDGRQGN